ncbi:hypothetical protein OIU74_016689 [Salix koriyanagi]|uniref:Uncharacterized protein n=1 Tax=Salix koriyanagi TaxID=2511006 RepID=A0A9Q0SSR9_9ROSI|nr:hypothetical protein OIU74_016689 [Salix koriyanagi]
MKDSVTMLCKLIHKFPFSYPGIKWRKRHQGTEHLKQGRKRIKVHKITRFLAAEMLKTCLETFRLGTALRESRLEF